MTRLPRVRSPLALAGVLLAAAVLLLAGPASAKYTPPALPRGGGVVSTGGWLAPYDVRKYNEELDMVRVETGFEIDVLVVGSLEGTTIDEVATTTLETWKPGDPGKENGVLLVVAPNFPKDDRKARLVAGKGVTPLTPEKARDILQTVIAPRVKADDVRGGIAAGIAALGYALGSREPISDAGFYILPPGDAGWSDGGVTAPSTTSQAPSAPVEGLGTFFLYVIGGFIAVVLAYVGFMRVRGAKSKD